MENVKGAAFILFKGFVLLLMTPCDKVCVGVFRAGSQHSCTGIVSGSVSTWCIGWIEVIDSPWDSFQRANHVSTAAVLLQRMLYVQLCGNPAPAAVQAAVSRSSNPTSCFSQNTSKKRNPISPCTLLAAVTAHRPSNSPSPSLKKSNSFWEVGWRTKFYLSRWWLRRGDTR